MEYFSLIIFINDNIIKNFEMKLLSLSTKSSHIDFLKLATEILPNSDRFAFWKNKGKFNILGLYFLKMYQNQFHKKWKKYICLDVINGTMGTIVIIKSTEFTIMVFYHKRKNVRHKSHNLFRGSFKKIEMIEIEILSNDNFPLWPEKPAFVGTTHLEIINNLYIECFSRKNEKKIAFFYMSSVIPD